MPPISSFSKKVLALAISQVIAHPLSAATITVNSSLDTIADNDNSCTLREAVISSNTDPATTASGCFAGSGDDNIEFAIEDSSIVLTNGQIDVTQSVTISGHGKDSLTIDGNGKSRACSTLIMVILLR